MAHRISEEHTRKEMIDPQLVNAGWYMHDHSKVKIEIHFVDVGQAPKCEVFGFLTHEGIRRVGEAFANGKHKDLTVMAT